MCGICGIVAIDGRVPADRELLKRMCDTQRHRGPDAEGLYATPDVGLGVRRLSIIDVAGGHQPVFNETGTTCVVVNGEIYNYQELAETLRGLGHSCRTRSDTEVVVHAYEQWGDECVLKLDGMFAFAVWDSARSRLLVGRDRLGKKPLYYYTDGHRLLFASEIKALLEDPSIPRRVNYRALQAYLVLGYVPAPDTMFEGIFKLPAGHVLTVGQGTWQVRQYWDLTYAPHAAADADVLREHLTDLLDRAVRARLMSDVPLGALLSGGIDSSLVVAFMRRHAGGQVDTYSAGFSDESLDESPHARLAAEYLGTRHHEIRVDDCTPELLEHLVWHLDEPVADPAIVPTYVVCRLARDTVTVVLTGEGGDELFAGYDYYHRRDPWPLFSQLIPEALRPRVRPALARSLNRLVGRERYHERTIWHMALPESARMLAWVAVFTEGGLRRLWRGPSGDGADCTGVARDVFTSLHGRHDGIDELHRSMYIDTKAWLPDDLLMKVDKMSMAASVEARCPFLDHHVVEFVSGIPTALKVNRGISKLLLKQVAAELLPPAIISRPKHTFDVPAGRWLTGSLRELVLDVMSDGVLPGASLFARDAVDQLWNEVQAGRPGAARQLWSLTTLGVWASRYRVGAG